MNIGTIRREKDHVEAAHLIVLQEILEGGPRTPFWDNAQHLHAHYEEVTPAD